MGDPSHQSNVTCREYLVAKIFKGGGGGVDGGGGHVFISCSNFDKFQV